MSNFFFQRNDRRDSDGDGDRKWQWNVWDGTGTRVGFMLNTDMELAHQIDVDADLGTTGCWPADATDTLPVCTEASTMSLVKTYATVIADRTLSCDVSGPPHYM